MRVATSKNMVYIIIIILLALGMVAVVVWSNTKNVVIEEQANNINALQDSLVTIINPDSSKTSSIQAFATGKPEDFLAMKAKDSIIRELQALVKEYKSRGVSGAATFNTQSKIKAKSNTGKSEPRDTIKVGDTVYLYPTYSTTMNNEWYLAKTVANKDSTSLELTYFGKYDLVMGKYKGRSYGDIITRNPHDSVKIARIYIQEEPKPSGWGLGIHGGLGAAYVQGRIYGAVVISLGLNKNIIKFK